MDKLSFTRVTMYYVRHAVVCKVVRKVFILLLRRSKKPLVNGLEYKRIKKHEKNMYVCNTVGLELLKKR